MLINLHVKNLALIKEVDVDFTNGLIVLTGETGAGKSLILGSVNIALGSRVSRDIIRNGEEYALVELAFLVSDKCKEKLSEMDVFVGSDNIVTVSRKITELRSVSKINGETVNINILKNVMSLLVDIHGQHDHQSLLYPANHLAILDKFAKESVSEELSELKKLCNEYKVLESKLASFNIDEQTRTRELEFAEFEVNEIEEADLKIGEDAELEEDFKKLSNSEEISDKLSGIYQLLSYDMENSAGNEISRAITLLNGLKIADENIEQFKSVLYDMDSLCHDLSGDIKFYIENLEFDPVRINAIESRLNKINHLKQKYGRTIEEILDYRDKKQKYIYDMKNYSEKVEAVNMHMQNIYNKMNIICYNISEKRKSYASKLQDLVVKALKDLNFLSVDFKINISKKEKITENGYDDVEFMISTNPGEKVKPLSKVASGGELSRIMLAIKSILAGEDEIETLIFDEIDTGISGKTASMVAEKLAAISRHHQVICISHLSQIAAMADNHYLIEKKVEDNSTVTDIFLLNREQSVNEIVRINGDGTMTGAAINHAIEMKDMADRTKSNLV